LAGLQVTAVDGAEAEWVDASLGHGAVGARRCEFQLAVGTHDVGSLAAGDEGVLFAEG